MKRFFGNHTKLIAFVLLLVGLGAWWLSAPVRGKLAAHFDVAQGSYRVLTYGLPPSWLPEYARLLHERYGVELKPVAGCVVSQALISYVDAYDQVGAEASIRKYKHDIFEECKKEARKNSELRAAEKTVKD